jgi:hypothetical protein
MYGIHDCVTEKIHLTCIIKKQFLFTVPITNDKLYTVHQHLFLKKIFQMT